MTLRLQISLPDCSPELREFKNVTQLVIGRSESCDLSLPVLHDLSRQHAKLEFVSGQWLLSDLGSKFGTFVNDIQIEQPVPVSATDTVRLGGLAKIKLVGKTKDRAAQPAGQGHQPSVGKNQPSSTVNSAGLQPVSPVAVTSPHVVVRNDTTGARPWHIALGILTAGISAMLLIWYVIYTSDQPKRGYTFLGLTTGVIGTAALGLVGFYAARKRALQELIPWKLLTWLRWHLWLSIIGFWAIAIHAGFHLDGGSGTWAAVLLLAAVGTGVVGWYQYKKVPGQVVSTVGNLATGNVKKQIDVLNRQIDDQLAGRDPQIASRIRHALTQVESGETTPSQISWDLVFENPQGEPFVDEVKTLVQKKNAYAAQLEQQTSLHKSMRWWLWLHIPASILFGVLVAYHIFDATEIDLPLVQAGPHEFADPTSCIQCHQAQYDDWIGSVHAMAMSSPVTELQNYLVVKKDRFDAGRHGVVVGQLCIECHAPTSVKGNFWEKEDLLATIDQRAPSSQFGVSCVACHQVGNVVKTKPFDEAEDFASDFGKDDIFVDYKNFENLEYIDAGRTMFGTIDNDHQAGGSIVGNSVHKGEFASHMNESSFCASCHTVMVDPDEKHADGTSNIVTLQNTYHEWKEGSDNPNPKETADSTFVSVNWNQLGVNCMDCHSKPLDDLEDAAEEMQAESMDLSDRVELFKNLVVANAAKPLSGKYDRLAANGPDPSNPSKGFDHQLKHQPKHLHTFVGVDYHLEKDMPYPKDHPLNDENLRIQEQTIDNITQLMKIAAAVKIVDASVKSGEVKVEVANLATGHHLPAGFAFAREMWLEVGIKENENDRRFEIVRGGSPERRGQPLADTEKLDKYGSFSGEIENKLINFQAVLWNGDEGEIDSSGARHGETVLQNECKVVLKGKKAHEHGFFDRHLFLKPGEIRPISIDVKSSDLKRAELIRVRLRFRNYPPEFLEQLADRFEHRTDRYKPAPESVTEELHTPRNYVSEKGPAKDGGFASDPEMWDADLERATRTRKLINRLRIFEMAEDTVEFK